VSRQSNVNVHELERWLERHTADLVAANITSAFSRGPTIASRQGASWISFQSKHTLGRVVLSHSGDWHLTATRIADGVEQLNLQQEFSSSVRLDEALDALVRQLS
jgi:hypothetical protein